MLSYQMGRRVLVGVALFSLVLASLMFTSRSSTKQTVQLSLQQDIPDDRSKLVPRYNISLLKQKFAGVKIPVETTTLADASVSGSTTPADYSQAEKSESESSQLHEAIIRLNFTADYKKSDDLEQVIRTRSQNVIRLCKKLRSEIDSYNGTVKIPKIQAANSDALDKRYLLLKKQRFGMCTTPKAGSTYWKSVFMYLHTGATISGSKIGFNTDYNLAYIPRRRFLTIKEDGPPLQSFMVVRNPWNRLVSLYQQKVEGRRTRQNPYFRYMLNVCHKNEDELRTFKQMLECVLDTAEVRHKYNRHWEPIYMRCNVCDDMNYDNVIRIENMMNEGAYVLRRAGITNPQEVLQAVRKDTIREVEKKKPRPYSSYYQDIPDSIIQKLRDMYKYEFILFDYPDTPFTE